LTVRSFEIGQSITDDPFPRPPISNFGVFETGPNFPNRYEAQPTQNMTRPNPDFPRVVTRIQTTTISDFLLPQEHVNKAEFKCPMEGCIKYYRRKGDLKYHIMEKHCARDDLLDRVSYPKSSREGKNFPCPIGSCKCGYVHRRDLRRHIIRKHPMESKNLDTSLLTYEIIDQNRDLKSSSEAELPMEGLIAPSERTFDVSSFFG